MCGIAGLISRDPRSPLILQGMCDVLCHRGPDDQGFFMDTEEGVYLGFNRLSVIDLSSRARQPIFNEDKKIIAVVNGEIYNFQELKRELKNAGHVFRSDADSEVIVHAYEEWGEDFVHRINGMFAVALTDKKENKVILARDPIGIKPLYYLKTDELFAFASETKAFFKISPTLYQPRLNLKAAEMLLLFPFIPDDSTALEAVRKVPPGSMLVFKNQEIRIKRYWRLENKKEDKLSFGAACGHFEEKITRIVESHLQSDVPVGIFLSGGVDSSFLAAVAVRVSAKPITAFTAGFDHPLDENAYALSVSRHLGLEHISLKISTDDTGRRIENIIGSFDDLSCVDGGLVTHYLLAEKIKEAGFKVVLSGEGADEIFGGYPWFSYGQFPYSALPQGLRNGLLYRRISKNLTHAFTGRGQKAFNVFMNDFDEKDIFQRISKFEICRQLPNHFLMKLDKATMAHGVETRVPYLDRTMVEFAYHLPDHFKRLPGGLGHKRILRQVAAKYLPQNIAARQKRGFSLPIKQFLEENEEKVRDYILQSNSLAGQLLPLKKLKSLWDFQGVPILAKEREVLLWKLFIMEVWHSRFFKEAASKTPLHHNIQKTNSCCVSV